MSAEFVCLTLIAGRSLRDELFDYLSEQCDLVSGFTASDAAEAMPTSCSCGQFFECKRRRSCSKG
jgi:hypothetical protein